ncbi:helix-turn-helix domain-containing protein [Umezakia ovalisporum]|jgi:DNA-binding Lrp family transcriptional regulator|uniref:helix-turn-helix domain-containing protein n=1 Tax=Umezakia ovalisporum TaxID=75695 RepID=UPI0028CB8AE3|nr:helix-turn-helix domain-containing protein [Umezakia ovalisporum]
MNVIVTELPEETQWKLEVIQSLLKPCDRTSYGQKLKEAAAKLDVSVRTVQRLVKKWEENGLVGYVVLVMRKHLVTGLNGSLRKRGDAIAIICGYYPSVLNVVRGLRFRHYGNMECAIAVDCRLGKWRNIKKQFDSSII